MSVEGKWKMTNQQKTCYACETQTEAYLCFSEPKEMVLVICYRCLAKGIRYIVRKANEDDEGSGIRQDAL